NDQGEYATPTVVAFTDNKMVVGEEAVSRGSIDPRNKITRLKQMLGRNFGDVDIDDLCNEVSFELVSTETGLAIHLKCSPPRIISVEEIVSLFFRYIRGLVERHFNNPGILIDAVLTYPPTFPENYKRSLYRACQDAGINVRRLLAEPVAATLAYVFQKYLHQDCGQHVQHKNVLVYDLGAGTCNISLIEVILRKWTRLLHVEAVATADDIGGLYFDDRLCHHFIQEFKRTYDKDLFSSPRVLGRLRLACECSKRILSVQETAILEVDLLAQGIELRSTVTREMFRELCNDLLRSTTELMDQVFRDSKIERSSVDDVVLVGGSTRIPDVQITVSRYFRGKELYKAINPDEVVVYGSALQALNLTGKIDIISNYDILIIDCLPRTLGTEIVGGFMSPIVKRGDNVPLKRGDDFTTSLDGQSTALIRIFAGESYSCIHNTFLGELYLTGIPNYPKGVVVISVLVEVYVDFTVVVEAEIREFNIRSTRRFDLATSCLPFSPRPPYSDIQKYVEQLRVPRAPSPSPPLTSPNGLHPHPPPPPPPRPYFYPGYHQRYGE
ncbi:HSP70-domain-containing protein, partial [Wilcoxina mikolae CBS 423.85]